jgi:esterase
VIPAHTLLGAADAPRFGFVTHGVLGAGNNLRSFMKRITDAHPEFRFALVDLRLHGKNEPAAAPHTLETCVDDFIDLAEHLGPPEVFIGHSLGGKVALCYGKRTCAPGPLRPVFGASKLKQIWALDSDPGAQIPGESHQVLQVLSAISFQPPPFPSRAAVIEGLMSYGLSSGLANWLSTNLEKRDEGYVWRLDLDSIRELLDDYFSKDLWPFLESLSQAPPGPEFHLVVAENSDRWSGTMKERARSLPPSTRFHLHELERSGHWVHVDNPDGLERIVTSQLFRAS